MSIVECSWFSRAFILSLHSQGCLSRQCGRCWRPLSLNANAPCAAFAGEGLLGIQVCYSWVLPGHLPHCANIRLSSCFFVPPFQTCFQQQQLESKGIHLPQNTVFAALLLACFMPFPWTVCMWFEGVPHLCVPLFICVPALLGTFFGSWICKGVALTFIWSE